MLNIDDSLKKRLTRLLFLQIVRHGYIMRLENILEAESEAKRFLAKVKDLKQSEINGHLLKKNDKPFNNTTTGSKETGAVKRSSLDLS